jgi:casein kinase I family protein HRR25
MGVIPKKIIINLMKRVIIKKNQKKSLLTKNSNLIANIICSTFLQNKNNNTNSNTNHNINSNITLKKPHVLNNSSLTQNPPTRKYTNKNAKLNHALMAHSQITDILNSSAHGNNITGNIINNYSTGNHYYSNSNKYNYTNNLNNSNNNSNHRNNKSNNKNNAKENATNSTTKKNKNKINSNNSENNVDNNNNPEENIIVDLPPTNTEIKTALSCGEYFYFQKHKIGVGSFGEVYAGIHKISNYRVAIKIPNEKANINSIEQEIKYTKMLMKEPGFPILYHTYNHIRKNIIVETLLGPSLDKLFIYCGRKFPMKTMCLIGIQIAKKLESMHKLGLIHRDIKPNNFSWADFTNYNSNIEDNYGIDLNTVYLIDFGLSCPYMDLVSKKIYGNIRGFNFVGTLRYSSINSHRGIRLCRKDDLESLLYVLIYFYKGKLPWQDIKAKDDKEKTLKIKEKKLTCPSALLCEGMPREFEKLLCYVKNLGYDEDPDYNRIINCFQIILEALNRAGNSNPEGNFNYIWEKKIYDD